jgi:hypothetical protein
MGSGRREKPVVFILMNKQNLKTMEDIGTNLEGTIQLTTGHARFKTDEALEKSLFFGGVRWSASFACFEG